MAVPIYPEETEEDGQEIVATIATTVEDGGESTELRLSESGGWVRGLFEEIFEVFQPRMTHPRGVVGGGRVRRERARCSSRLCRQTNLPDLLTCHNNNHCPDINSVAPDINSDPSGHSLDIKIHIDQVYQRIGSELRDIADSYRPRQRRRHPAGTGKSFSSKMSFSLKLFIPVTFLTLSLAMLRKDGKIVPFCSFKLSFF